MAIPIFSQLRNKYVSIKRKSMFTALPGAARIEVDDIEIEDNEENLKVSPYLYHDGMYFKCKGRKDVPFVLLNSILKENLPSLYFDLLCILSDYTYLNSFLLRKRLAYLKIMKRCLQPE